LKGQGRGELLLSVDKVLLLAVNTSERDIVLCATVRPASARGPRVWRCMMGDGHCSVKSRKSRTERKGGSWYEVIRK
jgi:hypothetical protein